MPRLVGKQSNLGLYISLVMFLVVAGFFGLEYTGSIDVIPGFGKESGLINQQKYRN